jgi:hypothetical protein
VIILGLLIFGDVVKERVFNYDVKGLGLVDIPIFCTEDVSSEALLKELDLTVCYWLHDVTT